MTEKDKNQLLNLLDMACDEVPIHTQDRNIVVEAYKIIKNIRSEEEIDHIASTMDCSDYPQ